MTVWDKLTPVLTTADDAPYFPADAYDERRGLFIFRGALLLALAIAAHAIGLTSPWIWLDHRNIAENILLHSARQMTQFWSHPLATGCTPLGGTLLYLQFLVRGAQSTFLYHFTTLTAHAGNCLLIWLILRRLGARGAWLAAAIFAVHPIEVQSVTWASRQPDVLAAMAALGALLSFLRLEEIHPPAPPEFEVEPPRRTPAHIAMVLLLLAAALLQPSAVMIALLFPLLLWWKRGSIPLEKWTDLAPLLGIPAIIAATGLFVSEYHHEGGPAAALGMLDRLIISGRAVWFYAESILFPFPLQFFYPHWLLKNDLWMLAFPAGLFCLLGALWWQRKRVNTGVVAAIVSFLVLILPHLPLVRSEWMQFSFVADHLQYLAGIPLIALLAAGLTTLADRARSPDLGRLKRLLGGALIITGLATLTVFYSFTYYAGELALWKQALSDDPKSLIARAALSDSYLRAGKVYSASQLWPQALSQLETLKSYHGVDAGFTVFPEMTRAAVLEAGQHSDDAVEVYKEVLKLDPQNHEAVRDLALAYKESGDIPNALRSFADALRQTAPDDALLIAYGETLAQSGHLDEGVERLRDATRLNPNSVSAHLKLCMALFAQGKQTEAAEHLHKAFALDPRSFEAFMDSAYMLASLKDYATAGRMLQAAIQLRPDSADARDNYGVMLYMQGFYDEAVDSFIQAVKLKPDSQKAHNDLELAKQARDAKRK